MSTLNNIRILRNLHLSLRADRTLETGFRMGGSCLTFLQTHKDLGFPPSHQHVAIDPYQRSPFNDSSGLLAVERAGLSKFLDFREEYSSMALAQLLKDERKFSLVYIDGSHNFEDVFVDVYFAAQLLTINGVVALDDSCNIAIKKVLTFLRRNLRHCLQELDMTAYHPAPSIKYRIARALKRTNLTAFKKVGELERPYGYRLADF